MNWGDWLRVLVTFSVVSGAWLYAVWVTLGHPFWFSVLVGGGGVGIIFVAATINAWMEKKGVSRWRLLWCRVFGHSVVIPEPRHVELIRKGTTTVERWEHISCAHCGQQLVHYFDDNADARFVKWEWIDEIHAKGWISRKYDNLEGRG